MTQQLSAQMGVAFMVENKPGASFTLGTMDVVKAAPDGGTPEEFLALVRSEAPKWAEVVRRSGAKVD
jgi:tripartite-type tricarboxylate transporter receptor subunit TctC